MRGKGKHSRGRLRYRTVALVVVGMLAGTMLISPVGAHVTTGFKHLMKHLKKRFYTKQETDGRYLALTLAPRVAYGIDNSDSAPSISPAVLAQTTINAPAAGFLVIQGSADVYNSTGSEPVLSCFIRLDATDLESSQRDMELNFTTNSEENCETHTVAPVQAGSHTVQLRATSSFMDTNYDNKVVSAMWMPFGATGTPPTDFALHRVDQAAGSGQALHPPTRMRAP